MLVILVLEGEAALKLACHVDGSDDVMRPPLPLPTCADTPSSSVTMQRGMVTQLLQPTAVPPIALTPLNASGHTGGTAQRSGGHLYSLWLVGAHLDMVLAH